MLELFFFSYSFKHYDYINRNRCIDISKTNLIYDFYFAS